VNLDEDESKLKSIQDDFPENFFLLKRTFELGTQSDPIGQSNESINDLQFNKSSITKTQLTESSFKRSIMLFCSHKANVRAFFLQFSSLSSCQCG
jgi:hypothetical protein